MTKTKDAKTHYKTTDWVAYKAISYRNQAALAFGEELGELGSLDLSALNLSSFTIDDVQLKHGLGQIQTNDRQICSGLHGGLQV